MKEQMIEKIVAILEETDPKLVAYILGLIAAITDKKHIL